MKKIPVVIIDDENDFQWVLRNFLTRNGISVLGSFTRNQFLKNTILEDETDIVIITFETPKFLNELTLASLRKSYPKVKILVNSAFEDRDSVDKIMAIGVDGLIYKTSEDSLEIIKAIYALKENGKYFSGMSGD